MFSHTMGTLRAVFAHSTPLLISFIQRLTVTYRQNTKMDTKLDNKMTKSKGLYIILSWNGKSENEIIALNWILSYLP